MNRITQTFKNLKASGRKGLVGYLTAGDPDMAGSEERIRTVLEGGVDILELGVPFSDPTADGPTIQAASHRALAAGMNVERLLQLVANIRRDFEQPIVLFGYANPFFRFGYEKMCAEAARAGADGMLIVDVPFEEKDEIASHLDQEELCLIPLIAPTTSEERASVLLKNARGFVYYIMVKGVTGRRASVAGDVASHVEGLRRCTDLPVAVGFGISTGDQAAAAAEAADAVVVGSALIDAAQQGTLADLVRELREGLDRRKNG